MVEAETSDLELLPFLKDYVARGVQQIICTDINGNGILENHFCSFVSKNTTAFPDLKLVIKKEEDESAMKIELPLRDLTRFIS